MNTANIVCPEETRPFSVQAEIIRQIQAGDGQAPCYATPSSEWCDKKKECGWRSDCYDEARERG